MSDHLLNTHDYNPKELPREPGSDDDNIMLEVGILLPSRWRLVWR